MNFYVKTFGCKVNQFESEYFINKLLNKNFKLSNVEKADILIVNSCAVTKEAERQLFQFLRKIKREKPDIKIFLTGCAVDNSFQKIKSLKLPEVIVSNFYKKNLVNILLEQNKPKKNLIYFKNISNETTFQLLESTETYLHTRKFFKIQDGCNNYCSYCIIPYLRGKPRSLEIRKAVEKIVDYSKYYNEVVITGINIGIYGRDLGIENGLLKLLEKLENKLLQKNINNFRIRLSSLKPDEISNEFIEFVAKSKFLCPHFHISVQNLNNKIIKLMNRQYSFETIEDSVNRIKALMPFAAIGADLITGFPGEAVEEFEDNLKKIEKTDINFYHIFPFSEREGTKAANLKENADKKEKKRRIKILKELTDRKKENFIKKNLEKNFKVLIESVGSRYLEGYSENYIKIIIKNPKNFKLKNNFLNVKGIEIYKKINILGRVI